MSVIKMVKAMIVTAALVFALAITSYADGDGGAWIRDSNGWWYVNANRSYTTDNWQQINGNWYYFDSYGYLVTGWKQSPHDGKWYYLDPNGKPDQLGRMLTNQWIGDYYVGADGAWVESGSNTSKTTASVAVQNTGSSSTSATTSASSTQYEYDPIDLGHGIMLYPGFNTDAESSGVIALAAGKIVKKTSLTDYPYEVSLVYYGGVLSGDRRASGKVAAYDANGYELDFTILSAERSQDGQRLTKTWYLPAGTRTIRMK